MNTPMVLLTMSKANAANFEELQLFAATFLNQQCTSKTANNGPFDELYRVVLDGIHICTSLHFMYMYVLHILQMARQGGPAGVGWGGGAAARCGGRQRVGLLCELL